MKKLSKLVLENISESPDYVSGNNGSHLAYHADDDAYPFGYFKGKFYIGNEQETHYDMFRDLEGEYLSRRAAIQSGDVKLLGRIWTDSKVISFWTYPKTLREFEDVIGKLEKHFNTNILTNKKYKVDLGKSVVVHIEEYVNQLSGSNDQEDPDAAIMHTLSPLLKPKRKVQPGWGSTKMIGGKYTPGEWDAIMGRAEGRVRLADLIFETEIGQVSQNINVRMQVDKTTHAADRQLRDPQHQISEHDILEVVHTALPKLSKMLLLSTVNIGDSILIRDTKTNLNIIGVLERKEAMIDLVIITVMYKKDFVPKVGTKIIEI